MADPGKSQILSILSSLIFSESPCLWIAGWKWKVHGLICIFSLSSTCILAFLFYRKGFRSNVDEEKPPLVPRRAPLLGHLLAFFRDPASLCLFASFVSHRYTKKIYQLTPFKEVFRGSYSLPFRLVFPGDLPHIRSVQHQPTLEEFGGLHAKGNTTIGNAEHSQVGLQWSQVL